MKDDYGGCVLFEDLFNFISGNRLATYFRDTVYFETFTVQLATNLFLFFFSVQTTGLGGLKPNAVMVGWPAEWKHNSHEDRHWKIFLGNPRFPRVSKK